MPHTADIQVRFRDLDPMKHVNNAVYATYLEQARATFYEDVVGVALSEINTVLVQLEISYERAIEGTGKATVELSVGDLGDSSIPMNYQILSDSQRVATARTVQVYLGPETGVPESIPGQYRERLCQYKQDTNASS